MSAAVGNAGRIDEFILCCCASFWEPLPLGLVKHQESESISFPSRPAAHAFAHPTKQFDSDPHVTDIASL